MPHHQLFADTVHHIVEGEDLPLFLDAGVKHHLQQHVAQLLFKRFGVVVIDGFQRLVGFLKEIRADALMGLLPIPGTPLGRAQNPWISKQTCMPYFSFI